MNFDFKAQWIGAGNFPQSPFFRTEFSLEGAVRSARVCICGLGYYELYLNGAKVGDHVLDPLVTQYDQRARTVSYDIGGQLEVGANAIGVILGNGWYNCGTPEVWNFEHAGWRDNPKLICWLEADLEDGSVYQLVSNGAWKFSPDGPIRFNELRNGETYDARMELTGWTVPGYNHEAWQPASIVPGPGGVLEKQTSPACKVMEDIPPISVTPLRPGVAVFDLGVNMAGWVQLRVAGEAGTEITLRYGELLLESGEVDQRHIGQFIKGGDFQTDRYILKGGGEEIWEPRFTYHGFRYVQLEGFSGEYPAEMVTGRVVHTAFETIGGFECSNPDLNNLQTCTLRSFVGNFVGIPTDCPHREKNGWTGDAQLAAETGLIHYDLTASYSQWLQTMADTQRPSGQFPGIVPSAGWGYNWGSGPAWDSAFILIPWYVYLHTGNTTLIEKHYDAMARYMAYCGSMSTDHLLFFGLGDWCAFDKMPEEALTSSGYYYANACILSKCARLTNRPGEATAYAELAGRIKQAFNTRFYQGHGVYGKGEMTSLGCALYQGLVENSETQAVVRALVKSIEDNGYKADFGILGAKYIPRALADHGEVETAYKLISQDSFPGWVYWLRQGSTTLWESWGGSDSQNHIMFGDVSAWMVNYLAGIKPDALHPGFSHVILKPQLIADLQWVKASHRSPKGLITSAWCRVGDTVKYTIELPDGLNGELQLMDGTCKTLTAGTTQVQQQLRAGMQQ